MPRVVLSLPLPGPAEAMLREVATVEVLGAILHPEAYRRAVAGADALLPQLRDRIDGATLDAAGPQLRVVANYAVGFDNIDVAACTARGVWVGNTPDVLTDATADCTMALLLATARRVVEGDQVMRQGRYRGWEPDYLLGADVTGQTLGLLGFGRIGRAVARRARDGFAMRVLVHDPWLPGPLDEPGITACGLDALLAAADFVSCHVPLTDETRHLIGAAQLARMKPSAILLNTARGPIIDEPALVEALRTGAIRGAGLDVYEGEPALAEGLAACPNCVLLPHLGSATWTTRARMGELAAANVLAALRGERPPHCVNPEAAPRAAPPAAR